MTVKDKEILDRIHAKHYGKGSKAKKENARVRKAIKEKAIHKVNKKLAKAGIGVQFAPGSSAPQAPGEATKTGVGIVDQAKSGTRAALMAEAQKRGIKYFRILTKQELTDVLKPGADQKYIDIVTEHAQKRWKQGWGSKGKRVGANPERTAG